MEINEIKTKKDLATYLTEKMSGCNRNSMTFNWDVLNYIKKVDSNYYTITTRNAVDVYYMGLPVFSLTLKCKREAKKDNVWSSHVRYMFFVESFALAKGEEDAVIADVIERVRISIQKQTRAEEDKAARFLVSLTEHGFRDIEELASWIQYSASREQRLFLRSKVH